MDQTRPFSVSCKHCGFHKKEVQAVDELDAMHQVADEHWRYMPPGYEAAFAWHNRDTRICEGNIITLSAEPICAPATISTTSC